MEFFILTGGLGTRARPLSLFLPKPLFPLGGVPLLEILLKQLNKKGVTKGFVNLHYKGGLIEKLLKRREGIKLVPEPVLLGSKILKTALTSNSQWFFILNGDVLMNIPVQDMLLNLEKSGADGILLTRKTEKEGYSSLIFDGKFFKKREFNSLPGSLMYPGAAILSRKVIETIDSENFFETLEQRDFKITELRYRGQWLDIGSPEMYFEGERSYCKNRYPENSNSLAPGACISPESTVNNSILWENSRIEGNSIIRDSIITTGVKLRNCKVDNSIITSEGIFPLKKSS